MWVPDYVMREERAYAYVSQDNTMGEVYLDNEHTRVNAFRCTTCRGGPCT